MTRIRITMTVVHEYDANPENYGNQPPEAMLAIDLANANDDPFLFIGDEAEWSITGEIVEGNKP